MPTAIRLRRDHDVTETCVVVGQPSGRERLLCNGSEAVGRDRRVGITNDIARGDPKVGEDDIELTILIGVRKQDPQEQVDTVNQRIALPGRRPLTDPCSDARPPEGSHYRIGVRCGGLRNRCHSSPSIVGAPFDQAHGSTHH
jgi:hypothetical protein